MSGTSIQQIMTLTCAIIDDEPLAISLLESYVNKTPFLRLTAKFNSALEALPVLSAQPVELLFLDIQMPDMDGVYYCGDHAANILLKYYGEQARLSYESCSEGTTALIYLPVNRSEG